MGLKEVKSKVLEDAKTKADQIKQEAEQEKEEILDEAREEAEEIKKKYEGELEEEKESYKQKSVSNANMKAKQEELKAKQEMLDDVFDKFRQRLSDLSKGDKKAYLAECREKTDFEPGKVIGSNEFEELTDVEFEERDVEGVILISKDGEKRQDFTFNKILERFRQKYRQEVAEKLFE